MRVFLDFRCAEGHEFEALVDNTTKTMVCHQCPAEATKLVPAVKCKLEGVSGDFPGAHFQWAKKREQKMKEERKAQQG